MPRRQFVTDLKQAQAGDLPLGISCLDQGEDDGQLLFTFVTPGARQQSINVTAMVTDVSDYPKSHEYLIFCDEDTAPELGQALQEVRGTNRKTVFELLDIISATLSRPARDLGGDLPMPNSQFDDLDDDDEDIYASDDEAFDVNPRPLATFPVMPDFNLKFQGSSRSFRHRVRADLRQAKGAGFRVGHLGHLLEGHNSFVILSIKISKLGISEEAMQAWQIEPSKYLMLLLQFSNGYKTNEALQSMDGNRVGPNIGMRILTGNNYKPSLQEAINAFTIVKKNGRDSTAISDLPSADETVDHDTVRETFISRPLSSLLQERLVPILKYRSAGMSWSGAEDMYRQTMQQGSAGLDEVPDRFYQPESHNPALPDVVNADHLKTSGLEKSFPLLAMQFAIRHFVRCTEFCLVCHRRLENDLEAIKPYVCDSSLCLYQYMTLGFGPSIEHEILAQPYVVDLLVSFCYSSAAARKLKDFPDGLSLTIPPIDGSISNPVVLPTYGMPAQPQAPPTLTEFPTYEVGYDAGRRELIFHNKPNICPVSCGSWIVMTVSSAIDDSELHCRVSDATYFPTISIDEPITQFPRDFKDGQLPRAYGLVVPPPAQHSKPMTPAATPKWVPATFQVYAQDFEKLNNNEKCHAICRLLGTLPNVKEMQRYLRKTQGADLKHWVRRIAPPTLSLLRWIIASNRACIMQVDGNNEHGQSADPRRTSTTFSKSSERLFGMEKFVQFRFAMGAPDKEQRFTTEVRNKAESNRLKYPTIFAWHGSPLHNWHMIIREGLHFKNTDHGRAYGHGVYHARDAATSTGYSGMVHNTSSHWPNSVLKISTALALNEIVNATDEFVSCTPYYVVAQLDWIQTRYLFVSCDPAPDTITIGADIVPSNAHPQDPTHTPKGTSGLIQIPASAVKSRRYSKDKRARDVMSMIRSPVKKLKGLGGFNDPIALDDDDGWESTATDDEDRAIFEEEPSEPAASQVLTILEKKGNKTAPKRSLDEFVPEALDWASLPLMPVPSYAVSGTTKHLLKELQNLQKLQTSRPLEELGWYIDVDKIENVYQWIVELHSFAAINPKLPLVTDMKDKGLKSIVLEVRFNKDFPYTPPYVRVIRPHFLSFGQGGGGHIVIGGALCMELLTNTGWSAVSSMESVLLQIRLAIASDPPAKVDKRAHGDYGIAEAAEGYIRACNSHGWVVPPGFREMAYGAADSVRGV